MIPILSYLQLLEKPSHIEKVFLYAVIAWNRETQRLEIK